MTYLEAVEIETNHIVKWIDSYDENDIQERLISLKICMLACSDGSGDKEVNSLDEDELYKRVIGK